MNTNPRQMPEPIQAIANSVWELLRRRLSGPSASPLAAFFHLRKSEIRIPKSETTSNVESKRNNDE